MTDMNQNDHDLLIVIATSQNDIKNDMRAMADSLKELKTTIDATNQRQSDLENRMTNISGTVQRSLADQNDSRKELNELKAEHVRWRLYQKVAVVLTTPMYIIVLALVVEAAKKALGL
jgi:hypothetical protein